MYRKIYRLRSQFEHDEIDTEQATLLLGSMMEQAEASENKGAAELAKLAQNWIDKHDWKKDPNMPEEERHDPMAKLATSLRDGTLLDELELLAFALAENDIERIERHLLGKHIADGYNYENVDSYRDDGIITEQFTPSGNVFVQFKDTLPDGANIHFIAYIKDDHVAVVDCAYNKFLKDADIVDTGVWIDYQLKRHSKLNDKEE